MQKYRRIRLKLASVATTYCLLRQRYMNTGVQRSSSTPHAVRTSTSPPRRLSQGKQHLKKDVISIIAAHHMPYAATATIAYFPDLKAKVEKAMSIKGPRFLQVLSPCPLGIELRLSKDISESDLRDQFDTIFLAIGTQQPRQYPSKEKSQHSVMSGIEFLRRLNRGESLTPSSKLIPKQVAVVGGGNTSINVARCVRRLGAKVTVICAQDPHGTHHRDLGTEISTSLTEVIEAETEGVQLIYRAGVRRLVRSGEHLSGIEIAHVDQVHDRYGHFKPILFDGTEAFIPAGLVIR